MISSFDFKLHIIIAQSTTIILLVIDNLVYIKSDKVTKLLCKILFYLKFKNTYHSDIY